MTDHKTAMLRVARASAQWVWEHFAREDVLEAIDWDERSDLNSFDALVAWFNTVALANYNEDIPLLQGRPKDADQSRNAR